MEAEEASLRLEIEVMIEMQFVFVEIHALPRAVDEEWTICSRTVLGRTARKRTLHRTAS